MIKIVPISGRTPFSMFSFQLTHQFPILPERPLLMLCSISLLFQALGQLHKLSMMKRRRLKLKLLTFLLELTSLVLSGPLINQLYKGWTWKLVTVVTRKIS